MILSKQILPHTPSQMVMSQGQFQWEDHLRELQQDPQNMCTSQNKTALFTQNTDQRHSTKPIKTSTKVKLYFSQQWSSSTNTLQGF